MVRKTWREISAEDRKDPERVARIQAGARAMLVVSALTELRESLGLTQSGLASSLAISQARISEIEHQGDLKVSTLDEFVRGMGGELRISAAFPDHTVDLLGGASDATSEAEVLPQQQLTVVSPASGKKWKIVRHVTLDIGTPWIGSPRLREAKGGVTEERARFVEGDTFGSPPAVAVAERFKEEFERLMA
jgi:transcriptional regulator with XRE-family HTH domain